jgi:hypothetical protein
MIDELIELQIEALADDLRALGYDISAKDINCQFLDREEYIYIKSDDIYPDGNLPGRFGIYRGYVGGGVHSGARLTEIYRLSKRRQAKAQKALEIIANYFWQILDDIDNEAEQANGQAPEVWESAKL